MGWRVVSLDEVREAPRGLESSDSDAIDIASQYAEAFPDAFAGIVVSGDVLYLGFTTEIERHGKNLESRLPDVDLRLFRAKRSLQELRRLVDVIGEQMEGLRRQGVGIWSIGIDTARNRVSLMLTDSRDDWVSVLRRRFGEEILAFEVSDPPQLTN